MDTDSSALEPTFRQNLLDRRQKLELVFSQGQQQPNIEALLREVDRALQRIDKGTYGLCESCHEPIESERLLADPLVEFCLDHLTREQQRALEGDLELASQIQQYLLPSKTIQTGNWEYCYRYESAGVVSGDYCDLIESDNDGDLIIIVGDVSGKGVASSMLMAHLHATFHTLASIGLPLHQLVERANRLFCESTLPSHYATLVCVRIRESGETEVCNAGHVPPILSSEVKINLLQAKGVPLGLFCDSRYTSEHVHLSPGDFLVLYTDGITESRDREDHEYGMERFTNMVIKSGNQSLDTFVSYCLKDVDLFRGGKPRHDDITLFVIRRRDGAPI